MRLEGATTVVGMEMVGGVDEMVAALGVAGPLKM
jgi:hypothetical protein